MTDLNPNDPKTLIAREVPGMSQTRAVPLNNVGSIDTPEDYSPRSDVFEGKELGSEGTITANPGSAGETGGAVLGPQAPTAQPPAAAGKNVAFIYQSHNQESYLPELPGEKDPDKAYDPKKNVTQVGLRLAQRLEKEGIGAVHSDKNYPAIEKGFNYYFSYKYSLKNAAGSFGRASRSGLLLRHPSRFAAALENDGNHQRGRLRANLFHYRGQKKPEL